MSIQNKAVSFIKRLISGRTAIAVSVALIAAGAANAGDVGGEGIKVHGDWVVTVTNPDGSIAQERSFSNALKGGGVLLGSLLVGGQASSLDSYTKIYSRATGVPNWHIEVLTSGVTNTPECMENLVSDNPSGSTLLQADVIDFTGHTFALTRDLAVAAGCISGASYAINTVRSAFPGEVMDRGAFFPSYIPFSEKTLDTPITGILPDQLVTLKVTFSFE